MSTAPTELWLPLSAADEDRAWAQVDAWGGHAGFAPPHPHRLLRIPNDFDFYAPAHQESLAELHLALLAAFREVVPARERVLALDWNHTCYAFDLHQRFELGASRESLCGYWGGPAQSDTALAHPPPQLWRIPYLPDGDYYFHLSADFRLGTYGHPWDSTLRIFGQPLLEALERHPSRLVRAFSEG